MIESVDFPSPHRRVLIIGADGLRPDSFDPALMPTCAKLIKNGTLFTSFHSAFPSETRVSMTTLTTGVYPGQHGVASNLMYLPGYKNGGLFQTGDHNDIFSFTPLMSEPLVLRPTLGDRLQRRGMRFAVAGSGSPGATLLWNLNQPETVINPSTDYGSAEMGEVHSRLGSLPVEEAALKKGRAIWATQALIDVHLQNKENRAMVLWLAEPDTAQHSRGIGSPLHQEALRLVDDCVARVLEAIERMGLSEEIDILWISDHGHSTIKPQGDLAEYIQSAASALGLRTKFIVTVHDIYIEEASESTLQDVTALIEWLNAQNWCGRIFTADTRYFGLPGVSSLEILFGPINHQRSPLLVIQPKWDDTVNEYGVPGMVYPLFGRTNMVATHGTLSPYDIHAFCLGVGRSFKKGHVSEIPCGIVDIAPTVCHLVGLREECGFDGRVLFEGLEPDLAAASPLEPEVKRSHDSGVDLLDVNGTRYLQGLMVCDVEKHSPR